MLKVRILTYLLLYHIRGDRPVKYLRNWKQTGFQGNLFENE
jgi:hypothetical protein